MAYVIKDVTINKYLKATPKTRLWVDEVYAATQFKTRVNAENAANMSYKKAFEDENRIILILSCEEATDTASSVETVVVKEIADQNFEKIAEALYGLSHLKDLTSYYTQEELKYERMTQDILHKIELDDITNLVDAFKLVEQLKGVRIKRREAKDKEVVLTLLQNNQVKEALKEHTSHTQPRSYHPRELPELFEKKEG